MFTAVTLSKRAGAPSASGPSPKISVSVETSNSCASAARFSMSGVPPPVSHFVIAWPESGD